MNSPAYELMYINMFLQNLREYDGIWQNDVLLGSKVSLFTNEEHSYK